MGINNLPHYAMNTEQVICSVFLSGSIPATRLPHCQYGNKCYRKNPTHFTQFQHAQSGGFSRTTYKLSLPVKQNNWKQMIESMFFTGNHSYRIYQASSNREITSFNWSSFATSHLQTSTSPMEVRIEFSRAFYFGSSAVVAHPFSIAPKFSIKCCTICSSQITGNFTYQCVDCHKEKRTVFLCCACESNRYHEKKHVIAKVYHDQQLVVPKDNVDDKLDEVLERISELSVQVASLEPEPLPAFPEDDEEEDNYEQEPEPEPLFESQLVEEPVQKPLVSDEVMATRFSALETLTHMGFSDKAQLWKLICAHDSDVEKIVSVLLNF